MISNTTNPNTNFFGGDDNNNNDNNQSINNNNNTTTNNNGWDEDFDDNNWNDEFDDYNIDDDNDDNNNNNVDPTTTTTITTLQQSTAVIDINNPSPTTTAVLTNPNTNNNNNNRTATSTSTTTIFSATTNKNNTTINTTLLSPKERHDNNNDNDDVDEDDNNNNNNNISTDNVDNGWDDDDGISFSEHNDTIPNNTTILQLNTPMNNSSSSIPPPSLYSVSTTALPIQQQQHQQIPVFDRIGMGYPIPPPPPRDEEDNNNSNNNNNGWDDDNAFDDDDFFNDNDNNNNDDDDEKNNNNNKYHHTTIRKPFNVEQQQQFPVTCSNTKNAITTSAVQVTQAPPVVQQQQQHYHHHSVLTTAAAVTTTTTTTTTTATRFNDDNNDIVVTNNNDDDDNDDDAGIDFDDTNDGWGNGDDNLSSILDNDNDDGQNNNTSNTNDLLKDVATKIPITTKTTTKTITKSTQPLSSLQITQQHQHNATTTNRIHNNDYNNNGWDDDFDITDTDDTTGNNNNNNNKDATNIFTTTVTMATNIETTVHAPVSSSLPISHRKSSSSSQQQQQQTLVQPIVSKTKLQVPVATKPSVRTTSPSSQQPKVLKLSPPSHPSQTHHGVAITRLPDNEEDGWDDFDNDDDLFDDDDDNNFDTTKDTTIATASTNVVYEKYKKDIEEYLVRIPLLQSSVMSLIEAECNTYEKALEMQQYYLNRPELTKYTIDKELARMDYTVRIVNDSTGDIDIFTDKVEIALLFEEKAMVSLVPRCSNQSLLADILQVITGYDMIIRPQYMTSAIATQCKFKVDITQSLVGVQATMDLTLPTSSGSWKIAEMDLEVIFSCPIPVGHNGYYNEWDEQQQQDPFVQFKVKAIRRCVDPTNNDWNNQIDKVATILTELHPEGADEFVQHQREQQQQQNNEDTTNFRDVFLQQTQNYFDEIRSGMRSALSEIDTATGGISRKIIASATAASTLLDEVEEAEREAAAEAILIRKQQQHPPISSLAPSLFPRPQQEQQPPRSGGLFPRLQATAMPTSTSLLAEVEEAEREAAEEAIRMRRQQQKQQQQQHHPSHSSFPPSLFPRPQEQTPAGLFPRPQEQPPSPGVFLRPQEQPSGGLARPLEQPPGGGFPRPHVHPPGEFPRQQELNPVPHHSFPRPLESNHQVPHPDEQHCREPPPAPVSARPTSILGGLVRTLAQTVALPEEDESLYQDWQTNDPAPGGQQYSSPKPSRDAVTIPTPVAPKSPKTFTEPQTLHPLTPPRSNNSIPLNKLDMPPLYNAHSPPPSKSGIRVAVPTKTEKFATLYQKDETAAPRSNNSDIPKLYNTNEKFDVSPNPVIGKDNNLDDGWDEEDVDIDIGDDLIEDDTNSKIQMDGNQFPVYNVPMAQETKASIAPVVEPKSDAIHRSRSNTEDISPGIHKEFVYDPTTGIIPTRKRWKNPRPGSRVLIQQH